MDLIKYKNGPLKRTSPMVLNTRCRGFAPGLRTRHYGIENIVLVETDGIYMVECEIFHKNFKKKSLYLKLFLETFQ